MDYNSKIDKTILGAVAVIFFVSSMILVFGLPGLFVSPDAVANFVFSSRLAEFNQLSLFEPLNMTFNDGLFPRSTFSLAGYILPVSFVGLPVLYGLLGKILGVGSVVLFTPILAAMALFAWRGVVEKLFNSRIALIASILLAAHPAWWYYTARGMMHNVLFMCLLIFAVWFLVVRPWEKARCWPHAASRYFDVICAGLLLGLALFVRASEIVWVAAAIIIIVVFYAKKIKWPEVILFGLATVIALLPMFFINNSLYGDPLSFGYVAQGEGVTEVSKVSDVVEAVEVSNVSEVTSTVLPFGFDLRSVMKHVYQYGFGLFWWMSILTLLGLGYSVVKKKYWLFHVLFIVVGAWLSIVYGSWSFTDNPDPNSVTIANSYVRYWLPVFLFCTVYAAIAIEWLRSRMTSGRLAKGVSIGLILIIAALGFRATFFAPEDGLLQVRTNLLRTAEIKAEVLDLTEQDSVIIVDHGDKIFFPDRTVRYPLRDQTTYDLMPGIVLRTELYYYGITFPESDMEYLNIKKLAEMDLQIDLVQTFDQESLYRIY
jgi:hypothetical protein